MSQFYNFNPTLNKKSAPSPQRLCYKLKESEERREEVEKRLAELEDEGKAERREWQRKWKELKELKNELFEEVKELKETLEKVAREKQKELEALNETLEFVTNENKSLRAKIETLEAFKNENGSEKTISVVKELKIAETLLNDLSFDENESKELTVIENEFFPLLPSPNQSFAACVGMTLFEEMQVSWLTKTWRTIKTLLLNLI